MTIHKIDHLGIAVDNLETAMETYRNLGFHFLKTEEVPEQKVKAAFFEAGTSHIELLEATAADSPIARYLAKNRPGIHHLCVEVDDIEAVLADYRAKGVKLINSEPVIGAGGCRVAFVHPKATSGVLLELKDAAGALAEEEAC